MLLAAIAADGCDKTDDANAKIALQTASRPTQENEDMRIRRELSVSRRRLPLKEIYSLN